MNAAMDINHDRTGKKPKKTFAEFFECVDCGERARFVLQPGKALRFPEHCATMMRMLDGFEVNKLLKKHAAEDIPELPDPDDVEEIE